MSQDGDDTLGNRKYLNSKHYGENMIGYNKRKKEGVTLAKMTVKMDVITQERTRYKMII